MEPAGECDQAKIIKLNKFTAERIASFGKKTYPNPRPGQVCAPRPDGAHERQCP
jgi:hypothetical protein